MTEKKHFPVPKDTRAYICANFRAVALDTNNICKVEVWARRRTGVVSKDQSRRNTVITE